MNAISHHQTASLVQIAASGARPRRETREDRAAMVVAALYWASVAVVALACAGAGVTMWLRGG